MASRLCEQGSQFRSAHPLGYRPGVASDAIWARAQDRRCHNACFVYVPHPESKGRLNPVDVAERRGIFFQLVPGEPRLQKSYPIAHFFGVQLMTLDEAFNPKGHTLSVSNVPCEKQRQLVLMRDLKRVSMEIHRLKIALINEQIDRQRGSPIVEQCDFMVPRDVSLAVEQLVRFWRIGTSPRVVDRRGPGGAVGMTRVTADREWFMGEGIPLGDARQGDRRKDIRLTTLEEGSFAPADVLDQRDMNRPTTVEHRQLAIPYAALNGAPEPLL